MVERTDPLSSSLAFLNGRWVQPTELTIPICDAGFVLGATVTEQLRTFGGHSSGSMRISTG